MVMPTSYTLTATLLKVHDAVNVPPTPPPASGSLLRVENSGTQSQSGAGFKRGVLSYLHFVIWELLQTERFGELLLGKSLLRSDNSGAAGTFLSLWWIKKDELLDMAQFREHLFHGEPWPSRLRLLV